MRPLYGQAAFIPVGMGFVYVRGGQKTEYGIPEKFKTLIVLRVAPGHPACWRGKRLDEQILVAKFVRDDFFQLFHFRVMDVPDHPSLRPSSSHGLYPVN